MTTTFTLSGDMADYWLTPDGNRIAMIFASAAGVDVSKVKITLAPASVAFTVVITVADAAAATATKSSLSSGILASASSLQTALADSGVSGVTVESAPVTVSSSESNLTSEGNTPAQQVGSNMGGGGSMGIVIGGAVGAVVVLGAIVRGGWFYLKKKKHETAVTTSSSKGSGSAEEIIEVNI